MSDRQGEIEGKVVAITGASSGVGLATARLLADLGAAVVLAARREEELHNACAAVAANGGRCEWIAVDVTRRRDLDKMVAFARERFGWLDVLINNAGIAPTSRLYALKVEDWDAMIDVDLRGTLYGSAAALTLFNEQDSGHIINIVSTAGIRIVPTMGVYAATKNAVRTISEALRQEAGATLRVTEISPGMTETNLAQTISDPATREAIARRRPCRRKRLSAALPLRSLSRPMSRLEALSFGQRRRIDRTARG